MMTIVNKTPKDIPALLRVADVAELLNISQPTVRKLIYSGDITGQAINPRKAERNHLRITRASVLAFYKKRFGHCLLRALNHSPES